MKVAKSITEAETLVKMSNRERKDKYCPLIGSDCRTNCVVYRSAYYIHKQDTLHSDSFYQVRDAYCAHFDV